MSAIECENGVWRESLPGLAFGHFVPGGAGQVSLNIDTDPQGLGGYPRTTAVSEV
jgi:hypothetical protein